MRKVEIAGSGFIKLEGQLTNLQEFKNIKKDELGLFEDPDGKSGHFAISFTPSETSNENKKNGVDGTFMVTYHEESDRDADFETIQKALKN